MITLSKLKSGLLPYPQKLQIGQKSCAVNSAQKIKANFNEAAQLAFLLKEVGFSSLPQTENDSSKLKILTIGAISNDCLELDFDSPEAYSLTISAGSIRIVAKDIKGIAFGVKTLIKIITLAGELPDLHIQDYPEVEFRTVHLCIFYPEDGTEKEATAPEDIKHMIKLAAMSGYNYVMLEFWGMFPYEKRPYATWPNKLYTREVVEDIISYAIDDLFITPLPSQNLTGHAGWSRIISRKHVVLDQRPDLADMWIPGGWCFATENPDTKDYLKDIMTDLLDTFRNPPFLHAGCDKTFGFGSNEEDRTKSADILFGSHISFLNTFLQERGTRMIMYADMLYTSMDALYWKSDPALVDMLPRNIVMNIWTHNDPGTYWNDPEFFESKGFQTVYSPWIDKNGVDSMVDVCKKRNSYGLLQTSWHMPQSAANSIAYSGAVQWSGKPQVDVEQHLNQWYK
jgi:glycosyl hydrolase family 20